MSADGASVGSAPKASSMLEETADVWMQRTLPAAVRVTRVISGEDSTFVVVLLEVDISEETGGDED